MKHGPKSLGSWQELLSLAITEAVAPPRDGYPGELSVRLGTAIHPYHRAGTPRCGRTGTWFSGPGSSCRRAGAWGCRSGGVRTGCLPHSSASRSPTRSTGPSRRPALPARGQEKLNPSLSLSLPSCCSQGELRAAAMLKSSPDPEKRFGTNFTQS